MPGKELDVRSAGIRPDSKREDGSNKIKKNKKDLNVRLVKGLHTERKKIVPSELVRNVAIPKQLKL